MRVLSSNNSRVVGVDAGFLTLATLSTGEKLDGGCQRVARQIAEKYDVVCAETLDEQPYLAKFLWHLARECKRTGARFIQVSKWFASSRICWVCGYKIGHLATNIREWGCPRCQTVHDRDVNAAKNILQEGLTQC